MKKRTREQLILAAPASIAAVIAVGASVHANGKAQACRAIEQQLTEQPTVIEVKGQ